MRRCFCGAFGFWIALCAAYAPRAAAQFAGDFYDRPYLTGDWRGYRSALSNRGIDFHVSATQFEQGVAGGGRTQEFEYGGKLDYFFNLDAGKAGWSEGLFVNFTPKRASASP